MDLFKLPPLPRAARRMVWMARAVATIGLAIGIYVAVFWILVGETTLGLLVLAVSIAYVLTTWINPMSPWLWVALGALTGVFVAVNPGAVSITVAIALAVLFWMRGRIVAPTSVASLTPIFTQSVMEGAERYVAELTDVGWAHVGGYTFDSSHITVTAAVLLHPDADRYAVVTDTVFAIESRFADDRILVSLNSGRASLPPNYLANDILGATPGELASAHESALDILAEHGLAPLPLDPEAIVEEALASEVETTEWSAEHTGGGLFNFGGGDGPLDVSAVSAQRIDQWLAVPAVTE